MSPRRTPREARGDPNFDRPHAKFMRAWYAPPGRDQARRGAATRAAPRPSAHLEAGHPDPPGLGRVEDHQVVAQIEGGLVIETLAPNAHWADVRIADDGEGISRANLRRIFDPFFTTKRGKNGVGVGLATTKRMIDLHDGRIEVASRRGRGTRFSVSLPTNLDPDTRKTDESG